MPFDYRDPEKVFLIDVFSLVTGTPFEYQKLRAYGQSMPVDNVKDALHDYAATQATNAGAAEGLTMFEVFARNNVASGGPENAVSDFFRGAFQGLASHEPQFKSDSDDLPGRLEEERKFAEELEAAFPQYLGKPPVNAQAGLKRNHATGQSI